MTAVSPSYPLIFLHPQRFETVDSPPYPLILLHGQRFATEVSPPYPLILLHPKHFATKVRCTQWQKLSNNHSELHLGTDTSKANNTCVMNQ